MHFSLRIPACAVALVLLGVAVACGGAVSGLPGDQDDSGVAHVDAGADTFVPPGPPPNGEVPKNHHPTPSACGTTRGAIVSGPPKPNDAGGAGCTSDSECTAGTNGRCTPLGGWGFHQCNYDECFVDSDCGPNGVCECGQAYAPGQERTAPNLCSRGGDCSLDGACGAGGYCSPSVQPGTSNCYSPSPAGYFCHTPKDECVNDTDCAGAGGSTCVFVVQRGLWACAAISVCAG